MGRKTDLPKGTVTHWRPPDESCGNCRFVFSWVVEGIDKKTTMEAFQCHRYPPTVGFDAIGLSSSPRYPEVESMSWCGEWDSREGEKQCHL